MIKSVKEAFDTVSPSLEIYECRHCGTTVDGSTDTCPACGSTEIAHYEI